MYCASEKERARASSVHVQTVGLNAETKKCRYRAGVEVFLLTFPLIGLSHSYGGGDTFPLTIVITFCTIFRPASLRSDD